jgi:predicted signal transduction protein with EAL and GGDEF domain
VRYLDNNLPRITISVGVAAFPEAGDNPQSVLKAADDALYRAKESGRNRVELSTAAPQSIRRKADITSLPQLASGDQVADGKEPSGPGKVAAE